MNALFINKLEESGVNPTAVRLLVFRSMNSFSRMFSLADLEDDLDTVDKSTLSRTIRLFIQHKLIHSIDDGSGSVKYAVCSEGCNCTLDDLHVHFHCHECRTTFCLENVAIPAIKLPQGFVTDNINLVMKGLCSECSKK
ncbi:MAG: transcriptional repressor [Tannerella sp.]|jgi:Fur family ferric uptake transcriptional regulator|nr:transcriptional repressor [Tannerella sp.]